MTSESVTAPAVLSDELRAEQVAAIYRNALPGTFGSFIAAVILSGLVVYLGDISVRSAATFLALMVAHSAARIVLFRRYASVKPPPNEWRRWAFRASLSALAGGLCWGVGSVLLLMDPARPELQFIVILVCAAIAVGAITAFATYLPAYSCNLFAIMGPTVIWAVAQGDVLHIGYAVLATLWIGVIVVLARSYSSVLARSLRLQFENRDLAQDFRRAKDKAEEANLAKSRFLASASHDLRQPVHALGMFVGALRSREMDDQARRLVDQIDRSIASLDSLFGSLLDISRLDAGVIQPRTQVFAIRPLLERICRDEAPEAARKGIELRLVPCRLAVESDPVLLERILRNLVSNAVRYTESGRVLVGCRRGARLAIEIWDTGCGIAPDAQERIFEEFYQEGNPERDRARGLGLGLAIVRRLTGILSMPLRLRSTPGRGSVFSISVPLAAGVPFEVAAADAPPRLGDARFILVVDDEIAVQSAMTSLLVSSGHEVIVAGSCEEMLARIADCHAVPDLIVSDYRLRAGENGIATIQRLRSEFNEDIPAILMTGDTAPDRIREASESGCFLMHKPVPNAKLRAAIAHLTLATARAAV